MLKFSFCAAHFDTTKYLATVDSKIKPKSIRYCHLRCRRSTAEGNGYNDYITENGCYIDTNGQIWQGFNSEGTDSLWSGDIFVCYDLA